MDIKSDSSSPRLSALEIAICKRLDVSVDAYAAMRDGGRRALKDLLRGGPKGKRDGRDDSDAG